MGEWIYQYIHILVVTGIIIIWVSLTIVSKKQKRKGPEKMPTAWRKHLLKIPYYDELNETDRLSFEGRVMNFLFHVEISGIDTTIDIHDKILVASSAIIPVFLLPDFEYYELEGVLLYSSGYEDNFVKEGDDKYALGLVGSGAAKNKIAISRQALHQAFADSADDKMVDIKEFMTQIEDIAEYDISISNYIKRNQYSIPWLINIYEKLRVYFKKEKICAPIGSRNLSEFFGLAGEYFFDKPAEFKKRYPDMFTQLEDVFKIELASGMNARLKTQISRKDPCPCNSGIKYSNCCGKGA